MENVPCGPPEGGVCGEPGVVMIGDAMGCGAQRLVPEARFLSAGGAGVAETPPEPDPYPMARLT